jgi:hypothetical protein
MIFVNRAASATHDEESRCPPGIAVASGAVALVAAAILTGALASGPPPRLGGLVLVVAVFAAAFGDGRSALAVAALAWAIGNGFLVNQFGELRWHPGVDVPFLIGLLGAVAVGMTVARIRREVRTSARMRPFVALLRDDPRGSGPASSVGRRRLRLPAGGIVDGADGDGGVGYRFQP